MGQELEIYGDIDHPLFVAKDVAEWIGYDTSSINKMLDDVDENEKLNGIVFRAGQRREVSMLTEDGLYEVLMLSKKKKAKEFKKAVKSILKDIRKHGAYMTDSTLEKAITDPDFLIQLATQLKTEREQRRMLEIENKIQGQQIAELKPKATYYDLILQSKDLLSVTEIAKDYGMSAKTLNKTLHELGIQYKQSGVWFLYAKYQDKGYTQTKTQNYNRPDGTQGSTVHTYWTQSGRLFLYDTLKKSGVVPMIEKNHEVA